MQCPECKGLGIIEYAAGLVSKKCPTCKGTKEVPNKKEEANESESVVAAGVEPGTKPARSESPKKTARKRKQPSKSRTR